MTTNNTEIGAFINSQAEDTAPDMENDFLLSYDASAGAVKKVKQANLSTGGGGGGVTILHSGYNTYVDPGLSTGNVVVEAIQAVSLVGTNLGTMGSMAWGDSRTGTPLIDVNSLLTDSGSWNLHDCCTYNPPPAGWMNTGSITINYTGVESFAAASYPITVEAGKTYTLTFFNSDMNNTSIYIYGTGLVISNRRVHEISGLWNVYVYAKTSGATELFFESNEWHSPCSFTISAIEMGETDLAHNYNVSLGFNTGYDKDQLSNPTNEILIGALTHGTKNNQTIIGNDMTEETVIKGVVFLGQYASAPAYQLGAAYYNTTTNKLNIGGASAWEELGGGGAPAPEHVALYFDILKPDQAVVTGDDLYHFYIPNFADRYSLLEVQVWTVTPPASGHIEVSLHNVSWSQYPLATNAWIDTGNFSSLTAWSHPTTINPTYAMVGGGNRFGVGVVSAGSGALGLTLMVTLVYTGA